MNASATTAGALFSKSLFEVPPYQREYAWTLDEVGEFWTDLRAGLTSESYFLGLIILTGKDGRRDVVDGQQRILTLSLLASALYHEALAIGRDALADRIKADFLSALDYATDLAQPRVVLTDQRDNATLQQLLFEGISANIVAVGDEDSLSPRLAEAYAFLRNSLRKDLAQDAFKRLGSWTEFLTNRLYFAVFLHPDPSSAFKVFEVVNTRGRELTTADLLKNYILSQTAQSERHSRLQEWKTLARALDPLGTGVFVQYIRHVATLHAGHVLPRDLYDYLAGRISAARIAPNVDTLMTYLQDWAPLYQQILNPAAAGPAEEPWLDVFRALDELNVIAVRPILMALSQEPDASDGMQQVLRLVVRRIVVGNLGTGSVERRFGEAARKIREGEAWADVLHDLDDLNPDQEDFEKQLTKRSFNLSTLAFLRRSVLQQSITPRPAGFLHLIRPRQAPNWFDFPDDEMTYWGSTIGNSFLATEQRRPRGTATWQEFAQDLLPLGVEGEWTNHLRVKNIWSANEVAVMGAELAQSASRIWY